MPKASSPGVPLVKVLDAREDSGWLALGKVSVSYGEEVGTATGSPSMCTRNHFKKRRSFRRLGVISTDIYSINKEILV